MGRLADTYRAAGGTSELPPTELEDVLAEACRAGRAVHADLRLDDSDFVVHLARCGAQLAATTLAVTSGDLFLACAAIAGGDDAVRALRHSHRPVVARYLRHIDVSNPFLDEVEQRLWSDLLVSRDGEPPKLAQYSGAGPLAGFVGVSAQRIGLAIRRSQAVEARAVVNAVTSGGKALPDQEAAVIKHRYRDAFQSAVEEALGVLTDREVAVFRMHFIDGMTTGRIARVYKVSQPTVSRWLAEGRRRILAQARALLRARVNVSEAEFESIAGLLVSQLDLSVSRRLAAR